MEKSFVVYVRGKYLEQILSLSIAEMGFEPTVVENGIELNSLFPVTGAVLFIISVDFMDKGLQEMLIELRASQLVNVAVVFPISRIAESGDMLEKGIVDYLVVEPVRMEVVSAIIKNFLERCSLLEELERKEEIIGRLEAENLRLRNELEKLVPHEQLRKSIPHEVYKKVGSEEELVARAYEKTQEESSAQEGLE